MNAEIKAERLVLKSFTLQSPNGVTLTGERAVLTVTSRHQILGLTVLTADGASKTLVFTPGCAFLGEFEAQGTLEVLNNLSRVAEPEAADAA